MDNVILIGMPSCGKSTVGVILAKRMGYKFCDCDLLIQEREGKLLWELIEKFGNDGFLKIENDVNKNINTSKSIISTGGSVVYCDEAMQHLKSIGKVVYIKISYENLCVRLGDFSHRGVIMRSGSTLLDMYNERAELYEKYADITVEVGDNDNLTKTMDMLLNALALPSNT